MSDSHNIGRSVWCRTSPRAHGKISHLNLSATPFPRAGTGWARGGGWDRSTGSSASNQLLPVVNVLNINIQCGLHEEYNVLLLERPHSCCYIVKKRLRILRIINNKADS